MTEFELNVVLNAAQSEKVRRAFHARVADSATYYSTVRRIYVDSKRRDLRSMGFSVSINVLPYSSIISVKKLLWCANGLVARSEQRTEVQDSRVSPALEDIARTLDVEGPLLNICALESKRHYCLIDRKERVMLSIDHLSVKLPAATKIEFDVAELECNGQVLAPKFLSARDRLQSLLGAQYATTASKLAYAEALFTGGDRNA